MRRNESAIEPWLLRNISDAERLTTSSTVATLRFHLAIECEFDRIPNSRKVAPAFSKSRVFFKTRGESNEIL
jgi:hypothetical protein